MVAVRPVELAVQRRVACAGLAIPVGYKLNGYGAERGAGFVAKHEVRLRQGAEDELTQIDAGVMNKEEVEVSASAGESSTRIIDLVPAGQLSEPADYSPMHIFVRVFVQFRLKVGLRSLGITSC